VVRPFAVLQPYGVRRRVVVSVDECADEVLAAQPISSRSDVTGDDLDVAAGQEPAYGAQVGGDAAGVVVHVQRAAPGWEPVEGVEADDRSAGTESTD
jgi:hypothetical protein